jgi:hypothetical protein
VFESGQLSGYCGLRGRPGDERPVANDPYANWQNAVGLRSLLCRFRRIKFGYNASS